MKTKTIKLSGERLENGKFKEYTTILQDGVFDDHDVIFLTGARESGKSFPSAKYISSILEDDEDAKFIYMRINDKELATFSTWCNDMNLQKLAGAYDVKLQRGKPTRGDILLTGYDDEGMQIYERVIGKCVSLESSHTFKSGKYDEFKVVIFEEYTHAKMHPNNEKSYVFNFLENIVSIFRGREKKVILLSNNFKTIPLLESAVESMTGDTRESMFKNPIKIKIFRERTGTTDKKESSFMAYLRGEVYEDDDFKVNIDEFYIIYTNKNFVIKRHKVYGKKYYITGNKAKKTIIYKEPEFMDLKHFCNSAPTNEFYYQSSAIEKLFTSSYTALLQEITKFISDLGSKFIM